MIKNMNNGTIKSDHKNKQSCNDLIICGNKTRILKFLFATLRILKRSSHSSPKDFIPYQLFVAHPCDRLGSIVIPSSGSSKTSSLMGHR